MSQDCDKIVKENIELIMLPLGRKVLGMAEPEGMIEIPDDLQYTIERKPDFLKLITDASGNGLTYYTWSFKRVTKQTCCRGCCFTRPSYAVNMRYPSGSMFSTLAADRPGCAGN